MGNQQASRKILIVDDQQELLGVLRELLTAEQFDVTTAATAEKAVEYLRSITFNLLISDIGLPGMDGWQLVAAAKQYAPYLPVILITSWKDEDTEKQLEKFNVSAVIRKPFRVAELFREIERLNLFHNTITDRTLKIG